MGNCCGKKKDDYFVMFDFTDQPLASASGEPSEAQSGDIGTKSGEELQCSEMSGQSSETSAGSGNLLAQEGSKQDNSLEMKANESILCDDVLEVIIDWLPFEDKFRVKSVSKQFQRCANCVITRETVLIVDYKTSSSDTRTWEQRSELIEGQLVGQPVPINSMTTILKTMTNIREICFESHLRFDNENDALNVITDNCRHLRSIVFKCCVLGVVDEEVMQRFGEKFGQSLRSIEYNCLRDLWPLLKTCTNLESLSSHYFNRFDQLVAKNLNITHLDVRRAEEHCLKTVSQLSKLQSLSMDMIDDPLPSSAKEDIKTIATNCEQLNSFHIKTDIQFNANQFMSSFQHFQHLLRLSVELSVETIEENIETPEVLTIDALKCCHQLSHLTLKYSVISDTTLADIANIAPNLLSLHIHDMSRNNHNDLITDMSLISVSALKNLQSFHLICFEELVSITDLGLRSLIETCIGLKNIRITLRLHVSHETIDAIVEKGHKNPKIAFLYRLNFEMTAQLEQAVHHCQQIRNIRLCLW